MKAKTIAALLFATSLSVVPGLVQASEAAAEAQQGGVRRPRSGGEGGSGGGNAGGAVRREAPPSRPSSDGDRVSPAPGQSVDRAVPRSERPDDPRPAYRYYRYRPWPGYYYDPWLYGGLGVGYSYYSPWNWYGPGWGPAYGPVYGRQYAELNGRVRLKVTPRDAEVYVDNHYAGTVDDFDGNFQGLRLEPGGYHIEVRKPGFESLNYDVRVQSDRTITFRGEMKATP